MEGTEEGLREFCLSVREYAAGVGAHSVVNVFVALMMGRAAPSVSGISICERTRAREGAYNDYDMLLAGDAGLSVAEARIQMGMCVLAV